MSSLGRDDCWGEKTRVPGELEYPFLPFGN